MKSTESRYSHKTKLRELLFLSYFKGEIDKETIIANIKVSSRQFYRLQNKYVNDHHLKHGLCGERSNNHIDLLVKNKVLELYSDTYRGCNYEHFSELLFLHHKIVVKASTLREWLLSAKLSLPKRRKRKKYNHREPKSRFNQMLQLDGTFGDFLGNGTKLCLMHLVDDATKTSMAMLFDSECTMSALQLLYQWCLKYGIPESIYSDKHSTYKVNERQRLTIEEELEGLEFRSSEFGKICQRLNIKQIFAHSPQAKGRVEKKHQMYKDRYIKELKILGITTIDEANKFLLDNGGFIERLNNKFTIAPKEARSTQVLPNHADLAQQFTIRYDRTVRNDYTVQYNSVVYQLAKTASLQPRMKVTVIVYLNNTFAIFVGNKKLQFNVIENYVKPNVVKNKIGAVKPKTMFKEYTVHPFRQSYKPEKRYYQVSNSKQLDFIGQLYSG